MTSTMHYSLLLNIVTVSGSHLSLLTNGLGDYALVRVSRSPLFDPTTGIRTTPPIRITHPETVRIERERLVTTGPWYESTTIDWGSDYSYRQEWHAKHSPTIVSGAEFTAPRPMTLPEWELWLTEGSTPVERRCLLPR